MLVNKKKYEVNGFLKMFSDTEKEFYGLNS